MILKDLIHTMVEYCNEHSLAMSEMHDKSTGVTVLMIAPSNTIQITDAAMVAAHMLISGILSGALTNAEDALQQTQDPTVN